MKSRWLIVLVMIACLMACGPLIQASPKSGLPNARGKDRQSAEKRSIDWCCVVGLSCCVNSPNGGKALLKPSPSKAAKAK
jgi:hypothetical protein